MAGLIAGPLAEFLAKGRARFNKKVSLARRKTPSLDLAGFQAHLTSSLAPIAEALARESRGDFELAIECLFDLSLELVGRGYFDARYPAMSDAWCGLLPKLPRLLAKDPHSLAGAVTNTIFHLTQAHPEAPRKWLEIMGVVGPKCTELPLFLDVGKVVAWRSGLAQYRHDALKICHRLDPVLAYLCLGLTLCPGSLATITILNQLEKDPWFTPASVFQPTSGIRELRIVAVAGAFRGFGGEFLSPPVVSLQEGKFRVQDGHQEWNLFADAFGTSFQRSRPDSKVVKPAFGVFRWERNGRASKGKLSAEFPILREATSHASDGATLAVTIPYSHSVYLIAERDA